ncbi:t-SNARE [Polychaeton citri CBS 116435]|uniref:t-SNARE n=1 Tax=Polychaeton citri CBS 116435 TaxID=1314669 RepID=A0A9P4Q9J0_9PEZI|nr:t-SNARE [Polychaeton citri CBS 116435]
MSIAPNLGAWRDRTNLFISYRQSYTHHPAKRQRYTDSTGRNDDPYSESAGLMANQAESPNDAVIEMDLLPPRWLDIQDEVTQTLSETSTKMKRLDNMHAKHVLPGFDDESVKQREERDIEALTSDITRGFASCQRRIQRIDGLVREQQASSGGNSSQADEKMAQNLKISLATRVSEVSSLFRKKQSAYLKKLSALGGLGGTSSPFDRSSTPSQNPYNDPALMDTQSDMASAQSTLQQAQSQQLRRRQGTHDAVIEQREREIEKIAQGVIDLAQIFQELNSMVIDQGTLLDRIDYNVERTAEHVKEAEKELKVATGYQKRSTKRKIMLLLILIVVGMIILVAIKPKRRSGGSSSSSPPPVVEAPVPNDPGAALPPRGWVEDEVSEAWKQRRRRRRRELWESLDTTQ